VPRLTLFSTGTLRNLALRLFYRMPDESVPLIRLGCFFSEAARAGFLGDQFAGTGLPLTDDRTPVTAKANRGAYVAIIIQANFCTKLGLDVACTRAVVAQAVHVAERGNHLLDYKFELLRTIHTGIVAVAEWYNVRTQHHHLVHSTLTAVKNDWPKHAVSATHGGKKTTLVTYAGYTRRVCARRPRPLARAAA